MGVRERKQQSAQIGLFDGGDAQVADGKRVAGGEPTTDLVFSAHIGNNARLFAQILDLHVPRGATVADVTYGQGAFWREVEPHAYTIIASDIDAKTEGIPPHMVGKVQTAVDCRELPYGDGSFDCLALDPPYMEGLFRKTEGHMAGSGTHASFRKAYSHGKATKNSDTATVPK